MPSESRARDTSHRVEIARTSAGWQVRAEQWLPRAPEELFPFFADAYNLETLTPSLLNFRVVTPKPIEMRAGTLIDYKLKIRGLPVGWRTEITEWDPPGGFVDNQLKGPYKRWHHRHTFEPRDGGTFCTDIVDYEVPGWFLSPIVNTLFVEKDVRKIFEFRGKMMTEMFGKVSGST